MYDPRQPVSHLISTLNKKHRAISRDQPLSSAIEKNAREATRGGPSAEIRHDPRAPLTVAKLNSRPRQEQPPIGCILASLFPTSGKINGALRETRRDTSSIASSARENSFTSSRLRDVRDRRSRLKRINSSARIAETIAHCFPANPAAFRVTSACYIGEGGEGEEKSL